MSYKRLPENPDPFELENMFLAGGSLLSIATKAEISDYDYYPKTKEAFFDAIYTLCENNCFIVKVTERAVTLKCNNELDSSGKRCLVQIVYGEYPDIDSIFGHFDYTVCMGAFDCDSHEYHFHEDFWQDVASKSLRFNHNTRFPLNSLLRLTKYKAKGYFISKPEMVKLALTIGHAGLPSSWDDLENQIGATYGKEVKLSADAKELEFSFENAIEILSNMKLDFTEIEQDTKNYSPENVELLFSDKVVEYINVNDSDAFNEYLGFGGTGYNSVLEEGLIGPSIDIDMLRRMGIDESRLIEVDGDRTIYGYKRLKKLEDGTLQSSVYHAKKKTYAVGTHTIEEYTPYLFVSPKPMKVTDNSYVHVKVSFKASDIKDINSTELQVTKLFVEEIL